MIRGSTGLMCQLSLRRSPDRRTHIHRRTDMLHMLHLDKASSAAGVVLIASPHMIETFDEMDTRMWDPFPVCMQVLLCTVLEAVPLNLFSLFL
ncbi:hypothetical protein WN55_11142 [Dufourea novaeangliae]|uniref:Uncharacterized protein n=1 Tax=Dufourea novaeangliae TaxID=178035 RepID=A0A154PBV7_DUFNO|nr:hypothetical protein WN55_11142 [Dufourea novaeangliae]